MIDSDLLPDNIRDYLNSHPVFKEDGAVSDNNVFYHTHMGNLVSGQIYGDIVKIDYICSQYNISKEDCYNTCDIFRAAWAFDPKDEANLTMENATTFLKILDIFYQEHYGKPSEFQFPQETVTLQDDEDFIV